MTRQLWLAIIVFLFPSVAFGTDGSDDYALPVAPWSMLRYRHVNRQLYEFTCGAASLSTILRYFLGKNVSERDVLDVVKGYYPDEGSWELAQKEGLSFLDLKKAANDIGVSAQAYRLSLSDLAKLNFPVLVHLDKGGYKHFSVVKGVSQGRVWLADPIRGNVRDSVEHFSGEWSGVVLIVWDPLSPPALTSDLAFFRDMGLAEDDIRRGVLRGSANPQATYSPFLR